MSRIFSGEAEKEILLYKNSNIIGGVWFAGNYRVCHQ